MAALKPVVLAAPFTDAAAGARRRIKKAVFWASSCQRATLGKLFGPTNRRAVLAIALPWAVGGRITIVMAPRQTTASSAVTSRTMRAFGRDHENARWGWRPRIAPRRGSERRMWELLAA